jgi:ferredoxin-NADP reductase
MELRLHRLTWEAPGIVSLELVAPDGRALPAWEPGAHVELRLADGTERHYSLCGDPADRARYRIAVREVAGGRASRQIHQVLRPGALLHAGVPRNNFPLAPASRHLFIAGGIGITPLLPMLRESRDWALHYCVRDPAEAAFRHELPAGDVTLHGPRSRLDVVALLAEPRADMLIYCCGPERLMAAVEQAGAHWPEGSLRFEWFAPRSRPEGEGAPGAFEVRCARSGVTLTVPADRSLLSVLDRSGVAISSSCEQGVCGTCEVAVLEGEVEHRDSILSAAERAAGRSMMACVSRARGSRLVLDI